MEKTDNGSLMTLAEVALYLKIAERTVLRLVHKGILPGTKVGNQWRFFKSIIDDWLLTNIGSKNKMIPEKGEEIPLSDLIDPRYVILSIKPGEKKAVFTQLIEPLVRERIINIPYLFIHKLMYRENISSTGIGNGVAFPHIRNPRENPAGAPPVVVGICREGTDFDALDRKPVKLFFLLCADKDSVHLNILSRLTHYMIEKAFSNVLIRADSVEDFVRLIGEKETRERRIQ